MYGYYRSGKKIMGIREILLVHLMKDDHNAYCNVPKKLTFSEFGMGKHVCRGCKLEKRRLEKEKRKADEIIFTASMF